MKRSLRELCLVLLALCTCSTLRCEAANAWAQKRYLESRRLDVVASSPVIADIARHIGGSKVSVVSLTKGTQDIENVRIYNSMIKAAREADMLAVSDPVNEPWVSQILEKSGNKKIAVGTDAYVDCSKGANLLTGERDYYWLDPENAKIIADNLLNAMVKIWGRDEQLFRANHRKFRERVDSELPKWRERLVGIGSQSFAVCGGQWNSLFRGLGLEEARRFRLKADGTGLKEDASFALIESFRSKQDMEAVCGKGQVTSIVLPMSVGATRGTQDYFRMMDALTTILSEKSIEKTDQTLDK